MINSVTELRIKKTKLATAITATSNKLPIPVEAQFLAVCDWCKSADRVIVHSDQKPAASPDGLRLSPTKSSNLAVADVIRAYVVQIPGDEIFAIAAPNILIGQDQVKFFNYVSDQKMERVWAAYFTLKETGNVPVMFIMSAPVLPYILQNIPSNLTFDGESWALWMNDWLNSFMLKHRYFNGDQFSLALPLVAPTVAIEDPAPIIPAIVEAPVVKKAGRPKKVVAA